MIVQIIGSAYRVYNEDGKRLPGVGLQNCMLHRARKLGIDAVLQHPDHGSLRGTSSRIVHRPICSSPVW